MPLAGVEAELLVQPVETEGMESWAGSVGAAELHNSRKGITSLKTRVRRDAHGGLQVPTWSRVQRTL